MFRLDDRTTALAATDLSSHLACSYLTAQQLGILSGERGKPKIWVDPHAELIRERGAEHESEQLERLIAECGGSYVDLTGAVSYDRASLEAAHARTAEAMREGAALIFQPTLFDGIWQGRADFLRRVEEPSGLGAYSYEVLDTKLARQVSPKFVHQLATYSLLVAGIQAVVPERAHVILGDGSIETLRLGEYLSLHRRVRTNLLAVVEHGAGLSYPEPVDHCSICDFGSECHSRRVADDHLSLVAGAHRRRRDLLNEAGIATVAELATAPADLDTGRLGAEQYRMLRNQAALQVRSRKTGEPTRDYLQPERAIGYALLPPPDPGDIFFDLEGDPYFGSEGIEYLWGWWSAGAGYEHRWAHDLDSEKAALEAFVDHVVAARAAGPVHVYHYAPHERAKVRSLAAKYATREAEVDALLAERVLVDLLAVVRQGMQVGEESYSLKRLERHHGFVRTEHEVREGGGSIVAYETWLRTGEPSLLDSLRRYNEEDCRSTASLRDWLWDLALPEAAKRFAVDFAELHDPEPAEEYEPPEWVTELLALADRLLDGLAADDEHDTVEQAERRLLAYLLLFHRRESNPEHWRMFELENLSLDELVEATDAIGCIERDDSVPPEEAGGALIYTYRFPPQEFKLELGGVRDPIAGEGHELVALEPDHLKLKRRKSDPPPEPRALSGPWPIPTDVLRKALVDLVDSVLDGDRRFPAAQATLRREAPRLTAGALSDDVGDLAAAAIGLDHSILPIQGPPGTGKTYRGARMIAAALDAGKRVGVTAPSHAAIRNMLRELEEAAGEIGLRFRGAYKGSEYESSDGLIECVEDNKDVADDHDLVAGTAWLFARPEHRGAFDLLFVDEASQYSLANALAAALCADSVVLLGDPQQLPQVTKASHPGDSGAAVLEYLLDGADTIAGDRGVLLPTSWRMHPDVCAFVSERSYESKLHSREQCARRRVDAAGGEITGAGLRRIEVDHAGRSQSSPEEAEAIAAACAALLAGATVTDDEGATRTLRAEDILVVAPYNMAVRCIQSAVPKGVRVGTVDRFQGQEAPVVFYAMTCSAREDVPRGLDFLLDKNRLNVAVSRAQCLSIVVHSPRLLDADCPTLDSMRLLNGLCRYVEMVEAAPA